MRELSLEHNSRTKAAGELNPRGAKYMNIHHLELFYYVARYGGIGGAVRHIPYGIRQPTVSGQMRELEDDLGQTLFERRPFRLTAAGEILCAFVQPFFGNVEAVAYEIRGFGPPPIRVAGSPLVLREFMPQLLKPVRRRFPHLRFTLNEGPQAQIEKWFESREIDLAVMAIGGGQPPQACRLLPLIKLPLVLLVGQDSKIASADEFWKRDCLGDSLIGPPPDQVVGNEPPAATTASSHRWTSAIEVNSIELIEHYVRHGHGVGLSLAVPGKDFPVGLRVLPLSNFPPMEIGAFWRDPLKPPMEALVKELQAQARSMDSRRS